MKQKSQEQQKVEQTAMDTYEAELFVRKDGKIPYAGSGISTKAEEYTNSLGTDGQPTYYYGDEAATGTRIGDGMEDSTDENYYYWTIRTAKYYKNSITTKYYAGTAKQAKMFTIGIGMSGTSATTMLNPNQTNVDTCKNSNYYSEARKLYNLLNANQTPYAYSYADASKNKDFSLEIIGEETLTYSSLSEAQTAGYVKLDSETNSYYVDLSSITRNVTVNINYWEQ